MSRLWVWIDQDLCTGDGLCTDHCPEVFRLLDDGISYVVDDAGEVHADPGGAGQPARVPSGLADAVVAAALDCPGECIFLEEHLREHQDAARPRCAPDEYSGAEHPGDAPRAGDAVDTAWPRRFMLHWVRSDGSTVVHA
jgi:ferredoxin